MPTTRPIRILSIGAHPADIFDQSGGVMAHHAERGDYVACIVLTHGARVHDRVVASEMKKLDQLPEAEELDAIIAERAKVKELEVRKGCDILGVSEVRFLGWNDGIFLVEAPMIRALARLIRELKPDIILTQYPQEDDGYKEHAIAGKLVIHAMHTAASVDPGDRNPPHRVAQVFFFGTATAGIPNTIFKAQHNVYNDVFIDIADVIDKKHAAIDCLVSQGYDGDYAKKRIDTVDGAFGNAVKIAYAEGFVSMKPEVHYYLPLTDHAIEHAASTDLEITERVSRRAVV